MTLPQTFRKKPVVIEAIQFTDNESAEAILEWAPEEAVLVFAEDGETVEAIQIETLEGVMTAGLHDWVIKGVQREYYPCKPDIFLASYEVADEEVSVGNVDVRPGDQGRGRR